MASVLKHFIENCRHDAQRDVLPQIRQFRAIYPLHLRLQAARRAFTALFEFGDDPTTVVNLGKNCCDCKFLELEILKLLYLDFDGVLHDSEVVFRPRQGVLMTTPNRSLFEWMPIIDELLLPHPDVRIVLSTSWVRIRSFKYAKSKLSETLQSKVIGATFHHGYMDNLAFANMPRGVQIANDVFRRGPQSWFAIDDDDFGWPFWCRDNLIRTTGTSGISAPDIRFAIEMMLERF